MLDAHAHLTDPRFVADLDVVLERARAAGVTRILTCGEDLASSKAAMALAERRPELRVAVGVHPHRAGTWSEETLAALALLAGDERQEERSRDQEGELAHRFHLLLQKLSGR